VERLAEQPVDMLEINISCPNVKEGGIAFGQNAASVEEITKKVEKICKTAGYYEIEPECNGYYRDGKSGRSRRSRCDFPD